jgi:hypothetical protein
MQRRRAQACCAPWRLPRSSKPFFLQGFRCRLGSPLAEDFMQQSSSIPLVAAALLWLAPTTLVHADPLSDVQALEAQCEQEREARIKPLREMEIEKCKADKQNDPAYCERYWKDYGNSRRTANGTIPRMFDDLPVCQAAFKARKALINKDG